MKAARLDKTSNHLYPIVTYVETTQVYQVMSNVGDYFDQQGNVIERSKSIHFISESDAHLWAYLRKIQKGYCVIPIGSTWLMDCRGTAVSMFVAGLLVGCFFAVAVIGAINL